MSNFEQYRAGFEAWFDAEYPKDEEGNRRKYRDTMVMDLMRSAWEGGKREASTEPSAPKCDKCDGEGKFFDGSGLPWMPCPHCKGGAGALTDDAKDAARLDHIEAWLLRGEKRGFKWDSYAFETGKTVREQLDAEIDAPTKAGSGK